MTPKRPTDDPRWDRLIHLVAGELSAEEAAELRRWVEADPERGEVLARLEEIWHATAPSPELAPAGWDAEAELRRIRAEAGYAGRVIARVGPSFELIPRRRSRFAPVLAAAAVLAVVLGGGLLWRLRAPTPAPAPAPVAMAEYRTAPGERLSFRLPDGTQVMLAPGGVVRRPATYGVRDRTVQLEGEAYFIVTHDSTRPFAVYTARAVARDLGTRFVVRAYQDEATTDVVVAEGAVAVGRGGATPAAGAGDPLSADSLVVRPRQRATITAAGQLVLARDIALDRYLSWTEGRLVFERTPLTEVARRLERWYGIGVRLADPSLGERRLTATLEDESSAEAVDLVATSLGLSVSRAANTYLLGRARP